MRSHACAHACWTIGFFFLGGPKRESDGSVGFPWDDLSRDLKEFSEIPVYQRRKASGVAAQNRISEFLVSPARTRLRTRARVRSRTLTSIHANIDSQMKLIGQSRVVAKAVQSYGLERSVPIQNAARLAGFIVRHLFSSFFANLDHLGRFMSVQLAERLSL